MVSPTLFLGDTIAALMQVSHVTNARNNESTLGDNTASHGASREARQILWKLLCELPGSVAMKELLILQGGSVGAQKVCFTLVLNFIFFVRVKAYFVTVILTFVM